MSIWAWLAVGTGVVIVLPIVLGLTLGRILGQMAREITDVLEAEDWSTAPLTRALEAPPEMPSSTPVAGRETVRRVD
jgi:hypothetical protein